jgi:hypothetical protein
MGSDIVVNKRQLRLLVDKCKSLTNGALSKMGCWTAPVKSAMMQLLLSYIAYLEVFGVPKLGKDLSVEDNDSIYNFITDSCCCSIHWARDEGNIDDLFKFA